MEDHSRSFPFIEQSLFLRKINFQLERLPKTAFHQYLFQIPALSCVQELVFHKPITFFSGENGTGKSTLLEAIAVGYGLNPEGGQPQF